MSSMLRVGGYVKLAKLWQKKRDAALELHQSYFEARCSSEDNLQLVEVYVDITGSKHIYSRRQMVKLLADCMDGKLDVIVTPSRAYLAANSQEFCYLIKFICDMPCRIEIISDDDDYKIDTILNVEDQRNNLHEMAEKFVQLSPPEYDSWKSRLLLSMKKLQGDA